MGKRLPHEQLRIHGRSRGDLVEAVGEDEEYPYISAGRHRAHMVSFEREEMVVVHHPAEEDFRISIEETEVITDEGNDLHLRREEHMGALQQLSIREHGDHRGVRLGA